MMTPAFVAGIGPLELVLVLFIVLLIVGGRRLPQLGRQLGGGLREFKDTVSRKADAHYDDEPSGRAALVRSTGDEQETPVDGEVVRDRR